jgi:hypothetical protein
MYDAPGTAEKVMSEPLFKSVYVDVGYRSYELLIVPRPLFADGEETWCVIDHEQQRIELSAAVPDERRLSVVAEAVSQAWQDTPGPWRMIPLTEPVD